VADTLHTLLHDIADKAAQATGLIVRQRQVTGSKLLKTLLFAWAQKEEASVSGLARAGFDHDLKISAQGLDKRFTQTTADFLKAVLDAAVNLPLCADSPCLPELFSRFPAIYVTDCSTVTLPEALAARYQGTGGVGQANRAGVKLDVRLEVLSGLLSLDLLQGRTSDNKSPGAAACHEPNCLRLSDLGYFNLARMREQDSRGEFWISRLQPGTAAVVGGDATDLDRCLVALGKKGILQWELRAEVGAKERLPVRLLLWRVPGDQASRRRAKMKENAQNQGRKPSQAALALCDWNVMITNVPTEMLAFEEVYVLYRVRWQIECLFKLWKTHGRLGKSRSGKPERILCEFYVKLLVALVLHWLCLLGLWQKAHRSLVKGCQLLREQAPRLAACVRDPSALVALLAEFSERFHYGCLLNTRKKNPNTSQRIVSKKAFC